MFEFTRINIDTPRPAKSRNKKSDGAWNIQMSKGIKMKARSIRRTHITQNLSNKCLGFGTDGHRKENPQTKSYQTVKGNIL